MIEIKEINLKVLDGDNALTDFRTLEVEPLDMTLNGTDDLSTAKIRFISQTHTELLRPGQICRYLHKERKCHFDCYVTAGDSKLYPMGEELHSYEFEELLGLLKTCPVRNVKTFQAGAYTLKSVLETLSELDPIYDLRIDENPLLNASNPLLVYGNATLYDVVSEIGRIIDRRPRAYVVENTVNITLGIVFEDKSGKYGRTFDIADFTMPKVQKGGIYNIGSYAGRVVSNVRNMASELNSCFFPGNFGLTPRDPSGAEKYCDWFYLPQPIKDVKAIKIYMYGYCTGNLNGGAQYVDEYDKEHPLVLKKGGSISLLSPKDDPAILKKSFDSKLGATADTETMVDITLNNLEEYKFLSPEQQERSVYFSVGDNKINIAALFERGLYRGLLNEGTGSIERSYYYSVMSKNPEGYWRAPVIQVEYQAVGEMSLETIGNVESDCAAFYNPIDAQSDFACHCNLLRNYALNMSGETRMIGHNFDTRDFDALPRIGDNVIDYTTGKRYVVTHAAIMGFAFNYEFIALVNENHIGKGNRITAVTDRVIPYVPRNYTEVSSSTHSYNVEFAFERELKSEGTGALVMEKDSFLQPLTGGNRENYCSMTQVEFKDDVGTIRRIFQGVGSFLSDFGYTVNFQLKDNTNVGIYPYLNLPIMYTDNKGRTKSAEVFYYHGSGLSEADNALLLEYYPGVPSGKPILDELGNGIVLPKDQNKLYAKDKFVINKDAHEMTGMTLTTNYLGLSNTIVFPEYVKRNYGGNGHISHICFYDHKISVGDTGNSFVMLPVTIAQGENYFDIMVNGEVPENYEALALTDDSKTAYFGNNYAKVKDGKLRLYWRLRGKQKKRQS